MGEVTQIEWCDHSFSPWVCMGSTRRRTSPENWREPVTWDAAARKAGVRRRVSCASTADWLDHEVPLRWRADLLGLVANTTYLDWLLLTKQPRSWCSLVLARFDDARDDARDAMVSAWAAGTPPANVWLGVSVEDQARADDRVPALLGIPSSVRFVLVEPLLAPVDMLHMPRPGGYHDWLTGERHDAGGMVHGPRVDWVVVGGECGPGARPMHPAWARALVRQCAEADVACFVKQTGDPAEELEDLRVRQWPSART